MSEWQSKSDKIIHIIGIFAYSLLIFFSGFFVSTETSVMKLKGWECTIIDYPPVYEQYNPKCEQWSFVENE